jgi:hypothetical protein
VHQRKLFWFANKPCGNKPVNLAEHKAIVAMTILSEEEEEPPTQLPTPRLLDRRHVSSSRPCVLFHEDARGGGMTISSSPPPSSRDTQPEHGQGLKVRAPFHAPASACISPARALSYGPSAQAQSCAKTTALSRTV